jgi:pantoate--beta-alanine ligase
MKQVSRQARAAGRVVGLVPTMGALHEGHLSLVRAAQTECSPVVVSLFVNPKQFGPDEDLDRYPRRLDSDRAKLERHGVDSLFAPSMGEIYPPGFATYVVVDGLGERLEGRSRPGHFRGVTTVVLKLFEIVQPARAYFGRKDAQQASIIRRMASDLNLDTQIIICPIVREADGLALSSRNAYLRGEERAAATALYRALVAARERIESGQRLAAPLLEEMRRALSSEPRVAVDYAELVDADTFESVSSVRGTCLVALAAFVGSTRLIDNMLIEERDGRLVCSL